jgi:hypothetical protein
MLFYIILIMSCQNHKCSKAGIKIHESNNTLQDNQLDFYNKIKNQNKHTGVRVVNGENEYNIDPFDGVNPFNNPEGEKELNPVVYDKSRYNKMDLNIVNYSQTDLYNLFGIDSQRLTHEIMKQSKKTVLKTHPDKSGLEPKYFLFFTKAYKRIYAIYEFQNKNHNKIEDKNEYTDAENNLLLEQLFTNDKTLKTPDKFNKWFNEQFDKHKLEDTTENGYGDWLKSDENVDNMANISQGQIADEMEKKKKQVQSLSEYKGFDTQYASTFGGSSLMDHNSNYTSGSLFSNDNMNYTDLKQAYVESVIPVTHEDYQNMPKFRNLDEYQRHRDGVDTSPIDKADSLKQLYKENKHQEDESVALAYYYAKQAEKAKLQKQSFWAGIKHLTN